MLTCKSPRKVMRVAYQAACQCLPRYSSLFSRHDFTLAQLFACLVVREHMGCSYRKAEALLKDSDAWCRDIGMRKAPDHATLHRAFHWLTRGMGSDAPDFAPMLDQALARGRIKRVLPMPATTPAAIITMPAGTKCRH